MVVEELRQTASANGDRVGTAASHGSKATGSSGASLPWAYSKTASTMFDSVGEPDGEDGVRSTGNRKKLIDKHGLEGDIEYKTVSKRNLTDPNEKVTEDSWLKKKRKYIEKRVQQDKELVKKGKIFLRPDNRGMSAQELVKFHPYPRIRRIVINRYFENAMTLLIIANCVIIGWQAGLPAEPEGTVKLINTIIEQSFTCFFFSELVLRAIAFNWTFFFDNENHLDIFLVTLSVLNTWMLAPMNIKADFLRKASVLRILRLVRVAKAYKTRFKEMWQLLRGIVDSLETLIWTYVMMGCVLYFFGITATIIFTKMGFFDDDEVAKDITVANFNDVLKSMFTLYQFMTLDSWTAISRPLADVHWWSDIFFFIFISVSVFVLMNLITAVIVDKAELAAKDDKAEVLAEKERQKEEAMKELTEIFKDIDEDNSGMIDREELLRARKRQKVRAKFRMMEIGKKDLDQLWDALCGGKQKDKRTGQPKIQEVRINDLVECIQRLKGEAKAKDILKLYREVRILEESIREMEALSDYFQKTARNTKSKLYTTFREMDAVRRTLQRVKDMSRLAVKSQCMSEGFVETSED